MIATLQRGLAKGPWILGESFSAADTLLGSSVAFCKAFGLLPDSEILEAYLDRCLERPAYQAALAQEQEAAAN
jgi:glutathione S-transferase